MYQGGFENFSINTQKTRNDALLEGNRRLQYAYLLAKHPETFNKMQKDNIILFHGTRIEALPGILKYGMNSLAESNKNDIDITTGERSTQRGDARTFISFTDHIGTALDYIEKIGKFGNIDFGDEFFLMLKAIENDGKFISLVYYRIELYC